MSEAPRKRSRFDQTDNAPVDPRKSSRFDRRSRSPVARDSESSRRSRSPIASGSEGPKDADAKTGGAVASAAAAAAAAAAAKINAQIQAKKAAGTLPTAVVAPVRRSPMGDGGSPDAAKGLNNDIYEQDGDWIKDIEVNDLRNRYILTKGATQKMIKEKTGADVTTRGAYYPDKSMATAANPPLYLHITSTSKEGLEQAVAEIEEMMKQDLPNLIDERRIPRAQRREPDFERDERGRRKWPEERIPIQLEPINGFNLRAQVVGHQGSYVKHIQSETGARVQIKGRGSGFYEHDTGVESDEPMYLHVAAPDVAQVEKAKELCIDLLGNVKQQYDAFKERGSRGGFGDNRRGGGHYGGGDRDRSGSYGNGGYGGNSSQYGGSYSQYGGNSQYGGGAQSPSNPQAGAAGAQGYDQESLAAAWAAYYAQNPQAANGQDPYAAYGGYENYVKQYQQYYGAQDAAGQQAAYGQQAGYAPQQSGDAPPPPPPGDEAPPPPPGAGAGGYNAVPPPPGM